MKLDFAWRKGLGPLLVLAVSGCAQIESPPALELPSVAPVAPPVQPKASLNVDASKIKPMYDRRLLGTDLPTVVRLAMVRNIDINAAQQEVEASRGVYEASIGMAFPSLTPQVTALGIQGAISNPTGLTAAPFYHVVPLAVLQYVINPGQVAYNIIASKRRLEASEEQDQAVIQETARLSAVQYYAVILAQAQVDVARRSMEEAEELLRIERLKFNTGTGLQVDVSRAQAALAARQENLVTALNGFYNASVALTVTLHLDPTVMLVPKKGEMKQLTLVRENLPIDSLLTTAVCYRPDLQALRSLLDAASADEGATVWGGLGPQVQAAGTLGPRPPAGKTADTEYRQSIYLANGGFNWSLATFGRIKSAAANVHVASLDVDRQLDQVQAAVVTAHQAAIAARKIIPIAKQEVAPAEEALQLTQKNLQVGTGLFLDVLIAQDALDQARLHYATALVQYNQSEVNLLAAMGLIDEASVEAKPRTAACCQTCTCCAPGPR